MTEQNRIYQIYYSPRQLGGLDPAFIPYDNSACPVPDEREFYVFRSEYKAGRIGKSGLTGFLSWKFGRKSGLTGKEFIAFCNANPGHDVYFVNPFPMEIFNGNVWLQGEAWHPGIKRIAQKVLNECGHSIDLDQMPVNLRSMAFCNFWVGTAEFWDRYMEFCIPIYDYIHNRLPEPHKSELFAIADHSRSASHFAFIFERLFSTFLVINADIRVCPYRYSEKELKKLYTQREIQFLEELRQTEMQFPNDPDPIARNPKLRQGLLDFKLDMRKADTPLRRAVYKFVRFCWHALPFRNLVLSHPYLRIVATRALYLFNPGSVFQRCDRIHLDS